MHVIAEINKLQSIEWKKKEWHHVPLKKNTTLKRAGCNAIGFLIKLHLFWIHFFYCRWVTIVDRLYHINWTTQPYNMLEWVTIVVVYLVAYFEHWHHCIICTFCFETVLPGNHTELEAFHLHNLITKYQSCLYELQTNSTVSKHTSQHHSLKWSKLFSVCPYIFDILF